MIDLISAIKITLLFSLFKHVLTSSSTLLIFVRNLCSSSRLPRDFDCFSYRLNSSVIFSTIFISKNNKTVIDLMLYFSTNVINTILETVLSWCISEFTNSFDRDLLIGMLEDREQYFSISLLRII